MRNRAFYRHCHLQYVNEFEEKVEAAVNRRFVRIEILAY